MTMKRKLYLLTTLLILLVGCNSSNTNDKEDVTQENIIESPVKDSTTFGVIDLNHAKDDHYVVSGMNPDNAICFQYNNLPKEYYGMKVWIEYYESGKLVNNPLLGIDSGGREDGVSIPRQSEIYFSLGDQNQDGTMNLSLNEGSTTTQLDKKEYSRTKLVNTSISTVDYDEHILGMFIFNDSQEDKTEKIMLDNFVLKQIEELPHVYILKCQFHE